MTESTPPPNLRPARPRRRTTAAKAAQPDGPDLAAVSRQLERLQATVDGLDRQLAALREALVPHEPQPPRAEHATPARRRRWGRQS